MTEEEVDEYNHLSQESEEALGAIQGAKRTYTQEVLSMWWFPFH